MKTTNLFTALAASELYLAVSFTPGYKSILSTTHHIATELASHQRRSSIALAKRPPAIAKAIKTAIETSKKYGPASYKARLAWEAVEALENPKNGVLQLKQLDEDALADEEYDAKVDELKTLIDDQVSKVDRLKEMAKEIKAIKEARKDEAKATNETKEKNDALHTAIVAARKATTRYGLGSWQSAASWKAFDDIANNKQKKQGEASNVIAELDYLETTMQQYLALEEVQRVL